MTEEYEELILAMDKVALAQSRLRFRTPNHPLLQLYDKTKGVTEQYRSIYEIPLLDDEKHMHDRRGQYLLFFHEQPARREATLYALQSYEADLTSALFNESYFCKISIHTTSS